MTENLPPEPTSEEASCGPGIDHAGTPLGGSDGGVPLTDEDVQQAEQPEDPEQPEQPEDPEQREEPEQPEDPEQEGVSTEGLADRDFPPDDPSGVESQGGIVASPPSERSLPSPTGSVLRGMGWKMMAAAGTALLLAGFAAGLFFPAPVAEDPVSEQVTVATTPETVPTTTSAPTTTAPPATTAPPTTVAEAQPVPEVVTPPDLVVTDEPVADVADRLVPSVVHLEITGDNVFEQGAGSGVIFNSQGYIFTAAHVVETVVAGEADLTVRLSNGDRLPGEVGRGRSRQRCGGCEGGSLRAGCR